MLIAGCDPGRSGAVVLLADDGETWYLQLENATRQSVNEFFLGHTYIDACYIEQVNAWSDGGKVPSSRLFSFGVSYGEIQQAAPLCGVEPVLVTPQKWKKHFGLIDSGLSYDQKKKAAWEKAVELSGLDLLKNVADAYLIARYGMEQELSRSLRQF